MIVQETAASAPSSIAAEVWIAEFGLLNLKHLVAHKKYQGRLYRLTSDLTKTAADIIGFSAHFDLPKIRIAYVDIFKTQGELVFEIERNTKPNDLNVRYTRDRWNVHEVYGKSTDGLRPWIKTEYQAMFLPDKVLADLAQLIKVKGEARDNFFVRINFKERTLGLIGPKDYLEFFPNGAFLAFSLPAQSIPTIDTVDPSELLESNSEKNFQQVKLDTKSTDSVTSATSLPEVQTQLVPEYSTGQLTRDKQLDASEAQAKYATYSRSEIDYIMKQQAEHITNALGGKISAQQRTFQETMIAQEKAFNKLSDNFAIQLEKTSLYLENLTKTAYESTVSELQQFKKHLSKELEQQRSQINKTVIPLTKTLAEEAQKSAQLITSPSRSSTNSLNFKLMAIIILAIVVSTAVTVSTTAQLSELSAINTKLNQIADKIKSWAGK